MRVVVSFAARSAARGHFHDVEPAPLAFSGSFYGRSDRDEGAPCRASPARAAAAR